MARVKQEHEEQSFVDTLLTKKCFNCDGRSTGYWMFGGVTIELCQRCAEQYLPAFIADCIYLENPSKSRGPGNVSRANNTLTQIELRFWRALFLRCDADHGHKGPDDGK